MNEQSRKEIFELLESVGVKRGDTLMVHSAFSSFKRAVDNDARGLVELIQQMLGPEGTLVMPSFNFSILHSGEEIIFDLDNTPSHMGYLTEVFRTMPGTLRSRNLFNPLIASGRLAAEIAACSHEDSWGENSPFPILYRENAAILLLGADYNSVTLIHYAEQLANVPYRFTYQFPNAFIIDSARQKFPVRQTTFRKHPGYDQDFNLVADEPDFHGIERSGRLGDALVRCLRACPLLDLTLNALRRDPYFLVQRDIRKRPVMTRAENAFSPMALIEELWLLNRALVSDDYDRALDRLADFVPLAVHEFPSGSRAWDWIIPLKWKANKCGIYSGGSRQLLIDLNSHPLQVAAGSIPFKGIVSRKDLMQKISVHPDRPEAIPYRACYYANDWRICLSQQDCEKLQEDSFYVELDTQLADGLLKVGEVTIPGQTDSRIVIPIHLDHPGQCNDNLSGVAVAVELIRANLAAKRRHTLTFLFVPESIGTFAFLSAHEDLIPKLKYGITFDSIGAGGSLFFMRTFEGDTELDCCARLAMKKSAPGFREYGFLELHGYGNDERALQSPGARIPAISVSRHPYAEYHSSLDTPYIISAQMLREARIAVQEILDIVDKNFVPQPLFKGVPQLSRRGMWIEFSDEPQQSIAVELMLYSMNGINSVARIAEATGVSFDFAFSFISGLERQGLVARAGEAVTS